jgi:acyl carrier protein
MTVLLACFVTTGCNHDDQSVQSDLNSNDLKVVQQVLGELLKIKPQSITANKTFAQLHANDLDLIEAIMELEDRLKISIPDDSFELTTGVKDPNQLIATLTVAHITQIVSNARELAKIRDEK